MTRASYCVGFSAEVETVILEPPSTTWQLVTMMPSCRTMDPVPTPLPCWTLPNWSGWNTSVVTFTTAGSASWTTVSTGSVLAGGVFGKGAAEPPGAFPARATGEGDGTIASITSPARILRMREPPLVAQMGTTGVRRVG